MFVLMLYEFMPYCVNILPDFTEFLIPIKKLVHLRVHFSVYIIKNIFITLINLQDMYSVQSK